MAAYSGATTMIAEGHEERILRLEGNVQDASTKTAQLEVKVDHIVKQAEGLSDKMDDMATKLDQRIAHIDQSIEKVVNKMVPVSARLERLEGAEARRTARSDNTKKIFLSLLIAGGGAAATKLAGYLTTLWLTP